MRSLTSWTVFSGRRLPGLQRQAVDLVDQAIGVYTGSESTAWFNTWNPFFWLARIFEWTIAWFAQLPIRMFSLIFGYDQEEAVRSRVRRILTGLSVFFQGLAAFVFLLDRFGVSRWLGLK
jgi:hypothetical protein